MAGPANDLLPIVAAAGAAVVALALGTWLVLRRRAARSVPSRLRQAGDDLLAGFLLADADTGMIHVDYAVLTRQGIVVVDVRDVAGHVFGSETMQEWTVLARDRRFTFANPLPALYDRTAAVRRVVPETPVRGVVAFSARAEFSKGFPPNVVMFDALLQELAAARDAPDPPPTEALRSAWMTLRQEAVRGARQERL
jgi:hypothetical protein